MTYPKPPQYDGIDAKVFAEAIDNEINALVRVADTLIAGPTFDLEMYKRLVHHARQTKERLAIFRKGVDFERILIALVELFRVRDAATKPDAAAINAGLKDLTAAIDIFIPAAVGDFPKDVRGAISYQRFAVDGGVSNVVLAQAPPASLVLIQALRASIEA